MTDQEARDSFLADVEREMPAQAFRLADGTDREVQFVSMELLLHNELKTLRRELPAGSFQARQSLVRIAAAAWQVARECRIEDSLPFLDNPVPGKGAPDA